MEGGLIQGLQALAPVVISLTVLVALGILWRIDRSIWLMLAIGAEVVGILFRVVLFAAPGLAQTMPMFYSVWMLSALVFAAGLLGYALETSKRRSTP